MRIVNFRIADFGLLNAPVAAPLPGLTWGYKDPPAVIRHKPRIAAGTALEVVVDTDRPVFVRLDVHIRLLPGGDSHILGGNVTLFGAGFTQRQETFNWTTQRDGEADGVQFTARAAMSWWQRLGDALVDEALWWWNDTDRVQGWDLPPPSHRLTTFRHLPYAEVV